MGWKLYHFIWNRNYIAFKEHKLYRYLWDRNYVSSYIKGGPKVGIELLFICSRDILIFVLKVVAPKFRTATNFTELFFQQNAAPPHHVLKVRDYVNQNLPLH